VRPACRRRVARAQHRRYGKLLRLVVEAHRRHDRQVAPGVVVAVEERELLLAVGGVVGRIEIDRDPRGAPAEPTAMRLDHGVGQHVGHVAQLRPAQRVLEARERRLRGQGRARDGVAVEQQLVDRIVGQPGGVVAVGVTAREPEDALPQQLEGLMLHLARLASIGHTRGQPLRQLELGIEPLQQDRPAIRAGVRHVEEGDDRLLFGLESERDLRYTGCSHRASSPLCIETLRHRFYSTSEGLGGSSLSSFVNFPG
jgi:hypothetical protein